MKEYRVEVGVPGEAYEVVVGDGLLSRLGEIVGGVCDARKIALVTDTTVGGLFGMQVDTHLARAGFLVESFSVPPGESSKSWRIAGDLLEAFASNGLTRADAVLALGGGVVGDLAGFAAAVYQRGVRFVQVPTTLLAMVDSSVGGKTAVDLAAGKNLAGAFKQPSVVVADTELLAGLPDAEWRSGLAEVAKSALLDGEDFTVWMEAHTADLARRDADAVTEAVRRCVAFKASVVARDEKEEGPRECLNYGHTLGHAIEKVLGYGTVTHGAAVAEGIRFASRVAVQVADAPIELARRQDRLLDALGLSAMQDAPQPALLLDAMRGDKKSRGSGIRMVLVGEPGHWSCVPVDDAILLEHLEAWAATKQGA